VRNGEAPAGSISGRSSYASLSGGREGRRNSFRCGSGRGMKNETGKRKDGARRVLGWVREGFKLISRGGTNWRVPVESAASFRDGWLYTGDLATVDPDGFLYVIDRAKEFLKCGGTRVSCRQLEDRHLECEDLLGAAVIGVPDDVLGETVQAFVVPRNPACTGIYRHLPAYGTVCSCSVEIEWPRRGFPRRSSSWPLYPRMPPEKC